MIKIIKKAYPNIVKVLYRNASNEKEGFIEAVFYLVVFVGILAFASTFLSHSLSIIVNFFIIIILLVAHFLSIHDILFKVTLEKNTPIRIKLKSKKEITETRNIVPYFLIATFIFYGNHMAQYTIFARVAFGSVITQIIIIKNLILLGLYLSIYLVYIRTKKSNNTLNEDSLISILIVVVLTFFYLKGLAKYEFGQNKLGAFLENDNYTAIYKLNAINLKDSICYKDIKSKINVSLESRIESRAVSEFDGRTTTTEMENEDIEVQMIFLDKIYLLPNDTIYFEDSEIKLNKVASCTDKNGNPWLIFLIDEKVKDN